MTTTIYMYSRLAKFQHARKGNSWIHLALLLGYEEINDSANQKDGKATCEEGKKEINVRDEKNDFTYYFDEP